MSNAVAIITDEIYGVRSSFDAVVADRSINFEREAGFAIQSITANEYSLKIALGNKQSVINAVTNIAAIGISLNPAKKQAYLVPRDGKICLDISYMGLIDLAIQSGAIKWAQAALVYERDTFALNGLDKAPLHQYNPFATDRGSVVGVYVVVKTQDGEYLTHAMDTASVHAIRDRSSAWKAWVEKQKKCPWVTDEGEMMKKTCVKQGYKYWPKTDRLEQAIHHLNTEGGEGLAELAGTTEKVAPDLLTAWTAKAKGAKTADDLTRIWQEGLAVIRPSGDMNAYKAFKAAVALRGDELKQAGREPGSDDNTIDMGPTGDPQ